MSLKKETLKQDEIRFSLCSDYKYVLELIYFVGDRLMAAQQLIDFMVLMHPISKHKAERIIRELVQKDVLLQEYICLSYNPARTRILYLSKYATAYLQGLPNTTGADTLNKKHLSQEMIEKRVFRGLMMYRQYGRTFSEKKSVPLVMNVLESHASSYCFKANQYHDYCLSLSKAFEAIPKEHVKKDALENYQQYLKVQEDKKKENLEKGRRSRINKSGSLAVATSKKDESKKQESVFWDEESSLNKVLTNMEIHSVRWIKEKAVVFVDYLVIPEKYNYSKILKNLIRLYKLFSLFIDERILLFNIRLIFVIEHQKSSFIRLANRINKKTNEVNYYKELRSQKVLFVDALVLKVEMIKPTPKKNNPIKS